MRRWRKLRNRAGLLVGLVVSALALGVVVPRPGDIPKDGTDGPRSRMVLLLANAIHTDIAFPADPDVRTRFGFLAESGLDVQDPAVGWIVLGWGGRAFYTETPRWADLKPLPVLKALTVDSSVMHVALAGPINPAADGVRAVTLDEARFSALLKRAMAGFAGKGPNEPILLPGKEYGSFDRFYEARGWFNVVVGCNLWTAGVLRAGGLDTGVWTPLPFLLDWSLDLHNGAALSGSQRPVARQP